MLNGLALTGGRPLGDSSADEDDELLGRIPLKESEVADVGGVCEDHGIRRSRRRGFAGAGGLEDKESGDLHPLALDRRFEDRNPRGREREKE